jgi:hypothetical protein
MCLQGQTVGQAKPRSEIGLLWVLCAFCVKSFWIFGTDVSRVEHTEKRSKTLGPFENHEGAATQKFKTVSMGASPADREWRQAAKTLEVEARQARDLEAL